MEPDISCPSCGEAAWVWQQNEQLGTDFYTRQVTVTGEAGGVRLQQWFDDMRHYTVGEIALGEVGVSCLSCDGYAAPDAVFDLARRAELLIGNVEGECVVAHAASASV